MHQPDQEQIIAFLEKQLSVGESEAFEVHLRDCPACRQEVEVYRQVCAAIDLDEHELGPSLVDDVLRAQRARATAPKETSPRRAWLVPASGAALLAAAVLVTVLVPTRFLPTDHGTSEFTARAASASSAVPDAWVAIFPYRVINGEYEPLQGEIGPSDALAFGYENRRVEDGYRYLSVFAVDSMGKVFWYYPAHTDPRADPESIRVDVTTVPVELPDEIRHSLRPGPLSVVALFSREPIRVSSVESEVAKRGVDEVHFDGSVRIVRRVTVAGRRR
ncbi:MAG: zf-HC2 domain-containing protein [Deltaproteobacteria bacterium]|nr:zf-HC2 domain-containing protein [Deltaproteobacteria bacterium]